MNPWANITPAELIGLVGWLLLATAAAYWSMTKEERKQ